MCCAIGDCCRYSTPISGVCWTRARVFRTRATILFRNRWPQKESIRPIGRAPPLPSLGPPSTARDAESVPLRTDATRRGTHGFQVFPVPPVMSNDVKTCLARAAGPAPPRNGDGPSAPGASKRGLRVTASECRFAEQPRVGTGAPRPDGFGQPYISTKTGSSRRSTHTGSCSYVGTLCQ